MLMPTHICIWWKGTRVTVLRDMSDSEATLFFYEYGKENCAAEAKLYRLSDDVYMTGWCDCEFDGEIPTPTELLAAAHNNEDE